MAAVHLVLPMNKKDNAVYVTVISACERKESKAEGLALVTHFQNSIMQSYKCMVASFTTKSVSQDFIFSKAEFKGGSFHLKLKGQIAQN